MRRVIGMDLHRSFAEVVFWEDGRLRHHGRVDMTRSGLEGFGRSLRQDDEIVVEATGNAMSVVRVLSPFARVVIANPMQVKAIAHARIKTDKIDAGVLAQLHASGFLPEVWVPDERTERLRRLVARRNQVVRHRTRVKNEVHAILQTHLVPKCPHADLFNRRGRDWLSKQLLPDDERAAITRHIREIDRLADDLAALDSDIAKDVVDDPKVQRLLTIAGVNAIVASGIVAAIGDITRFPEPQKLVSYFGLNPRVRQSGLGLAQHGRISKHGRSHARGLLVEAAWAAAMAPGPLRVLPEDPHQARTSDRGGCHRAQAHRPDLASADEGRGLSLGPSFAGCRKAAAAGAEGRRAIGKGRRKARFRLRLQHQGAARPGEGQFKAGRESL
jgi:transposase